MIKTLGMLLTTILGGISLFHVYWAAGGTFGSGVSIPTVGGKRVFNPSPLGTIGVAGGLFMAMLAILGQIGALGQEFPRWIFRWATWGISSLFLLRAVGEFRLVGFFKQVRDTQFAYWDTRVFSPLCLVIALIAFIVAYKEA